MPSRPFSTLTPALAALVCAYALTACGSGADSERPVTVKQGDSGGEESSAGDSAGYPALSATRNTSRIDAGDAIEVAADVALATHPRFEGTDPVEAAVVVPASDWQAGIAASVLAADPLRAPILLSEPGEAPGSTSEALSVLQPEGGSGPADAAVYRVGDAAVPGDFQTTEVEGGDAAAIGIAFDKLRGELTGQEPEHILVVSDSAPEFSMPAAAWAARSGDPVLFTGSDHVPPETAKAISDHPASAVYVLGPESAVSDQAFRELARSSPGVKRVGGADPEQNSIAFAQYADDTFGWNITDPGHGAVIANGDDPAVAGAASTLSGSGTYGPLLLTGSSSELPEGLRGFLTSIKPGYSDDPTRALYNRIWLVGDGEALSGPLQAEIDELAELVRIGGPAAGLDPAAAAPGTSPGAALPGGGQEQEPGPADVSGAAGGGSGGNKDAP